MKFTPWLSLVLLIALASCRRNANEPTPTIVVSGDTAGWIVPCGCTSNQSGGLPRRGTFVAQCRAKGPVILADAGGAACGVSTYDRLKFEAILKGELAMDIAAHNIGRAEADLGPDALRRLQRELSVPFISANTSDAEGKPLAVPMRIVATGGRRVMFVGVLDPKYKTEKIRVVPPKQAILDVLTQSAGKFDVVIVLAYLPEEKLRQLAEDLPEVDALVGGPTGQPIQPSSPLGITLLASATKQGKFMAHLTCPSADRKNGSLVGDIVELDGRYADDPKQKQIVQKFYDELKRRDLSPRETSFTDDLPIPSAAPPNVAVAGSNACKSCHDDDFREWKKSKHAEAWKSLEGKNAQFDPDCQRCHVTGYGEPGGFAAVRGTPKRVAVGCESCHGMSSPHCKNTSLRTAWAEQAKDRCRQCHDRENSPNFNYDAYWAKIQHGKPAVKPQPSPSEEQ